LRYQVRSFVVPGAPWDLAPSDFIIRAERYGVPQARHRVILLGVRSDHAGGSIGVLARKPESSVWDAISDLPVIRSGVSARSGGDSVETWQTAYVNGRLAGRAELGLDDTQLLK